MKTAISIPDRIFDDAEETALRLKMSRSELYTKAVERFVATEGGSEVTAKLDAIYKREASSLDADLVALQAFSLPSEPGW
jgi:metal-responsive CopG/Arc/MetJ family transcriptional regulator